MKKIAFIVQQYGEEMYGGAELHCMRLAEKMCALYSVEVLTTCSFDFLTWADYYPQGESTINGVTVRRFSVSQQRSWEQMAELEKKVKQSYTCSGKGIRGAVKKLLSKFKTRKAQKEDYINWVVAQGPTVPDLINYIKEHEKEYCSLIFFSYLYYPTVFGVDIAPQKTILIPLAHDEWALRMPVFNNVFTVPACIMYNTESEKRMVNKMFNNEDVYSGVAGIGIDAPMHLPSSVTARKLDIKHPYILYVGRIDSNKITPQDFEWFLQYNRDAQQNISLILIGKLYIDIPQSPLITYLGFVNDEKKFDLIKGALFLFQPSRFESLSLVVLEAFAMGRPVLVHKDCEVMKGHVDDSNGGLYYNDYLSFNNSVDQLVNNPGLNTDMGRAGKIYLNKNYRWENIIAKFQYMIENRIGNTG